MAKKRESYVIGLDVGGTKIRAGLVQNGKIHKSIKFPTEVKKGKKRVLENIIKTIDVEGIWAKKISAIGIGIAGQIDRKKGIIYSSPNLPKDFKNVPLKKILEKKFKVPVFIDNDAHCFTLAESIYGAGKTYNYIVGITLGTGIGGGIVIDKKIYRGRDNSAAEFGHTTIDFSSNIKCKCGEVGHFETLASGTAMTRFYKKFAGKTKDTFEIENEALAGKKQAKKVIKIIAKYLGIGLANIAATLNPDIIIIGGGIARVNPLWKPTLQEFKKRVPYERLKTTKIIKTKLGNNAGILGASLTAIHKH